MPHEFLDHTGDTAVRIAAGGDRELLEEAAEALVDVFIDREAGASIETGEEVPIDLEAEDGETLLVDFLNELIFLFDSRQFLCGRIVWDEVTLGVPARLRGRMLGERFDPARHVSLTEVKAATFHDVEIRKTGDGLETTVVFDL